MDVRAELTEFLSEATGDRIEPDEDYFAKGLVNSLFALELVTFVERRFGLVVEVEDLDLDHFRTIDRLTEFVRVKTAA
ncbi:acyl carrier protein [Kutzneria kofuensis]|uniref:Acyl carrier protein n=1 Tax=Kutzneria kofuensis TaxID=103725 RepID=A0A7W9KSE6_9PSEU|nr:phosphopantetheine-binding protein [Kutzneria kofuensis]MBB5897883.1 acyl carrier protein [Kutzneria kofuensis]